MSRSWCPEPYANNNTDAYVRGMRLASTKPGATDAQKESKPRASTFANGIIWLNQLIFDERIAILALSIVALLRSVR